jgi:hypothetical protein
MRGCLCAYACDVYYVLCVCAVSVCLCMCLCVCAVHCATAAAVKSSAIKGGGAEARMRASIVDIEANSALSVPYGSNLQSPGLLGKWCLYVVPKGHLCELEVV